MKKLWLLSSSLYLRLDNRSADPVATIDAVAGWRKVNLSMSRGASPLLYWAASASVFVLPDYWSEPEVTDFGGLRMITPIAVELSDEDYDALISRIEGRLLTYSIVTGPSPRIPGRIRAERQHQLSLFSG